MKLIIEIKMDNAAFWPDDENSEMPDGYEVARILKRAGEQAERWGIDSITPPQDYNGNRVGSVRVEA